VLRDFGFFYRSRTIFCRAVPNPNITIRNFFVSLYSSTLTHTLRRRNAAAGAPESFFHVAAVDAAGWHAPPLALVRWGAVRALRGEVNRALEAARGHKLIRGSQEARVQLRLVPAAGACSQVRELAAPHLQHS
jgi:hypothetical protein